MSDQRRREIARNLEDATQVVVETMMADGHALETLKALIASAEPKISATLDGQITVANQAAEKLFGWRDGELRGRPITVLMPEAYRARHLAGLVRYKATGMATVMGRWLRLEGLRRDGYVFPIELKLSPFITAAGRFINAEIREPSEELHPKESHDAPGAQ